MSESQLSITRLTNVTADTGRQFLKQKLSTDFIVMSTEEIQSMEAKFRYASSNQQLT